MTWHVTVYEFDDDDNELDRTVTNSERLYECTAELAKITKALDDTGYTFLEFEPMSEDSDSPGQCILKFSFDNVDGTSMDVELSISD